ncbi:MAG: hypothetical protein HYW07_17350 [Candidatus Latescibacteria bacterium]|nr:hypothetical protein [Candidatus Latescibacterota bacterium]
MAYMRGSTYLWRDESHLHVWVVDGYDGWDQTGWGEDTKDAGTASGVGIPMEVMDEYVVMRLAQLLQEGGMDQAIARALAKWDGNFGCAVLKECANSIQRTL